MINFNEVTAIVQTGKRPISSQVQLILIASTKKTDFLLITLLFTELSKRYDETEKPHNEEKS